MQFWKTQLSAIANTDIVTPDLPTTFKSFESCLDKLEYLLESYRVESYSEVYVAGHSMGGLLAREYLQKKKFPNVKYLVCVGTPHAGSKLADIALMLPFVGKIWKPLHALKTTARQKLTTPNIPDLKIGVIVSLNNGDWLGKIFLSQNSDGRVESFSANASDAQAVAYVQSRHDDMQYDSVVTSLIEKFFCTGNF